MKKGIKAFKKRDTKIIEALQYHTHKEIAKKFKISVSRVGQIVSRLTKHKLSEASNMESSIALEYRDDHLGPEYVDKAELRLTKAFLKYNYERERAKLFTDEGQRAFLCVRDNAQEILRSNGAFRAAEFVKREFVGISADMVHASLDRMVELQEIKEVTGRVDILQRVFVSAVQEVEI